MGKEHSIKESNRKTSLTVEPELMRKFKVAAAERGMKFKTAVEAAFRNWTDSSDRTAQTFSATDTTESRNSVDETNLSGDTGDSGDTITDSISSQTSGKEDRTLHIIRQAIHEHPVILPLLKHSLVSTLKALILAEEQGGTKNVGGLKKALEIARRIR